MFIDILLISILLMTSCGYFVNYGTKHLETDKIEALGYHACCGMLFSVAIIGYGQALGILLYRLVEWNL
jgi:hypothetical protein